MAIHLQTLKTRSLTAAVFVVVMLLGLLYNLWAFIILFSIIHIGCWMEYLKIVGTIHSVKINNAIKWLFAVCGFTMMIIFGLQHQWDDVSKEVFRFMIGLKVLFWLLLAGLFVFVIQNTQISIKAKWMIFAGFFYISLPFTLLLYIRTSYPLGLDHQVTGFGKIYICAIIFSIWINDTMAYIVGSLIGKTPFSSISPKKTWEGTLGGAILCIVVISLLGSTLAITKMIPWYYWASVAAICAVFGTAGDLLESKLKRMANIKDSGHIMPGHGGFLDRFDSLLIATPFAWLYYVLN